MKIYTCIDCGAKFQEGSVPAECPNCGCPSSEFKESTETSAPMADVPEKVYFDSNKVRITNKIWTFGGYDIEDSGTKGISYYPVTSISMVSVSRDLRWWLLLLAGIALVVLGFMLISSQHDNNAMWGIIILIVSILLFWGASALYKQRIIHVKPHNSLASFTLYARSQEEANKYLKPMLKCLIENR